jgi:hypothetical protein
MYWSTREGCFLSARSSCAVAAAVGSVGTWTQCEALCSGGVLAAMMRPSALYLHDGELQPCRLDCCAVSVCAGTGGPLFTVCRRLYTPVWRKAAQSTGIHNTKNRMSTISFCKRNAQQQAIKEQREGVQPFSGLKAVLSAPQSSL